MKIIFHFTLHKNLFFFEKSTPKRLVLDVWKAYYVVSQKIELNPIFWMKETFFHYSPIKKAFFDVWKVYIMSGVEQL